MNVSVVIPTRGDVDLKPILQSLPEEWEVVVYDNGRGCVSKRVMSGLLARVITGKGELPDLSVYARYAAIEYAEGDLIFTQDDDCVVSDAQTIVDAWLAECDLEVPADGLTIAHEWNGVVCNMPPEFRHGFYEEHALVGFGACFHRSRPWTVWGKLTAALGDAGFPTDWAYAPSFLRTCDIPLTALSPRVLVDVPKKDMPWASDANRMWKQPQHQAERASMLELVKEIR